MIIRKLLNHREYLDAETLQRVVWGFADREIIPLNELVVAQKNGGLVFGAFEGKKMIGFCFGVPAIRDGKVFHYSRMLGVLPEYQGKNIGFKMKLFQRRFVLAQGLAEIRWTFDPLQARNSYLNLEKLGVTVSEYLVNFYGDSSSRFNRGIETDRFVPIWEIRSTRVRGRLINGPPDHNLIQYAPLILTKTNADGLLEPGKSWPLKSRKVSVEIPSDIDNIKSLSLSLAIKWRSRTRMIFTELFRKRYRLTGFTWGTRSGFYLVER